MCSFFFCQGGPRGDGVEAGADQAGGQVRLRLRGHHRLRVAGGFAAEAKVGRRYRASFTPGRGRGGGGEGGEGGGGLGSVSCRMALVEFLLVCLIMM